MCWHSYRTVHPLLLIDIQVGQLCADRCLPSIASSGIGGTAQELAKVADGTFLWGPLLKLGNGVGASSTLRECHYI